MSLKTSDYDYALPHEFIAQYPVRERDESKLLVYDRYRKTIEHVRFYNISDFLNAGDVLVLNDTEVLPARIIGTKENSGASIEILLLHEEDKKRWKVLTRPSKKARMGDIIILDESRKVTGRVVREYASGIRVLEIEYPGEFCTFLREQGEVPLPPYIKRKRIAGKPESHELDRERYQTVYAKEKGAAAAPTAGLHFSRKLVHTIKEKGVSIASITLHIGMDTFRPITEDLITAHAIHSEYYRVSEKAAEAINAARMRRHRVVAVGTTTVRTLETAVNSDGCVRKRSGWTNLFIYPPYQFKATDCLLTNFHLPRSTLLLLVAALVGKEELLRIYEEAKRRGYRFYSYGDAMFIT